MLFECIKFLFAHLNQTAKYHLSLNKPNRQYSLAFNTFSIKQKRSAIIAERYYLLYKSMSVVSKVSSVASWLAVAVAVVLGCHTVNLNQNVTS